jgi:hypothetical protein
VSGRRRVRDWQGTDPHLRQHPTFLKFRARLGVPVALAHGLLSGLWAFAFDFAHDGDVSRFSPEELSLGVGWEGDPQAFVDALSVGFVVDGIIHDWESWGGRLFAERKADSERKWDERNKETLALQESLSTDKTGQCVTMRDNGPQDTTEQKNLRAPPTPHDDLVIKARDQVPGWKVRPDDDVSFATFRKLYPAEQIERTIRELAVYQSARNGNRYKDPRLALGNWLKRQEPEKVTSHKGESGHWSTDYDEDGTYREVWVPDVQR